MADIKRSPRQVDDHLQRERAVNKQYMQQLEERKQSVSGIAGSVGRSRNSAWVDPTRVGTMPILGVDVEPLLGRIALTGEDPLLGTGFWVGSWETHLGSGQVVSWAAKVASLFFEGSESPDEAASTLLAIRTFNRSNNDLTGFDEDIVEGVGVDPFDDHAKHVGEIPTAPTFERPTSRPSTLPDAPSPAPVPSVASPPQQVPVKETPEPQSEQAERVKQFDPNEQRFRAEGMLRDALERPKTGVLGSVLATLQADQYSLVTWPDDHPLIVQGGPGTGKSIVAVHRAAFLTNPWRPGGPVGSVALIGPTERFVSHVKQAVDDLEAPATDAQGGSATPVVRSLLTLLSELAGVSFKDHEVVTDQEQLADTEWGLLRFARRAVALLRAESGKKGALKISGLINALAHADPALRPLLDEDRDIATWCTELGSFGRVSQQSRYLPFMAACGLALQRREAGSKFDHLVVDEAQDIRPLEWAILTDMVRNDRSMSLFGDSNQRRSDWSYQSWQALAEDMDWTDDDGQFKVELLRAGYRSTKQIIDFANQLLPTTERGNQAIQEGPEPQIVFVRGQGRLVDEVMRNATALLDEFSSGLVAVIAEDTHLSLIEDRFRRQGWRQRPGARNDWINDVQTINLLRPEAARGLEFEGVVVVPDNFPENVGRTGLLYTSLTRAVRKLVVVHARALPNRLKARR